MVHLSPFHCLRLEIVLTAALKAPGNRLRFGQGGLVTATSGTLVRDWRDRFTHLPILTKAVIRQAPGQFLATVNDIAYRGSTSGSRGQSYLFFAGSQWNQQRLESRKPLWEWWGIDENTPIINLASRLLPSRPQDLSIFGAINRDCLNSLIEILKEKPAIIRGYPSRLCEIASLIKISLPPIEAVICTGEPLFEQQKVLLESRFQAPVINEYGCHEAAVSGWTCPEAGRIHLDENRCFYEVIDDNLIVTDLWNETMPLIRYQGGDRVQLYPDSCPCGRPGLTIQFWGRSEDRIGTNRGFQPVGKVPMPPLPGILHYHIERQSALRVQAWLQPDSTLCATQITQNLAVWVRDTFGDVELKIARIPQQSRSPENPVCSDAEWVKIVTQQSISKWLASGVMPSGETQETAQLLKNLLSPQIIGVTLPKIIQRQILQLAQSPISIPSIENLKGRVLLLACSCISDTETAISLYRQACQRLQTADKAAILDQLIPILHLPLDVVNLPDSPTPYSLDSLNIYHLLAAFETAVQRRPPSLRPFAPRTIKPPLAVLLGDLSAFASTFTLAHLQHWVEFVQNQSFPLATPETPLPPMTAAWLQWRQQLLRHPSQATPQLQHLQTLAQTPSEQARFYLEKGYHHILTQTPLNPTQWLSLLETYAGKLTAKPSEKTADLTPWMPIVSALVEPLHQQNQHDLAYRCLVAASLSNRQKSAFERLTDKFNQKQAVLTDITPWNNLDG